MIAELVAAYRAVKEKRKHEEQYKRLIGKNPDYDLIRRLINECQHRVAIEIVFPDNSKLIMRREEDFDQLERIRRESW